ncbi:hypothetical protein FEM48_Zijuj01G0215800 [Ziziphus jujuba var. spinosa]|uniref:Uncharacterized protein n=1 Tax=Ziziphus jujuba var. spinosa TaxID=714518 RepID=A0A978W3P4_ZIZJJ|nr:hypothetical protein FEM48_Zijuj01G0215800 [Ziziphus jujuba var. spinosa]
MLNSAGNHYPRATLKKELNCTKLNRIPHPAQHKDYDIILDSSCWFVTLPCILMWPDLISKSKGGGIDVIQTYSKQPWSAIILPDCRNSVLNTAQVCFFICILCWIAQTMKLLVEVIVQKY